MKNIYSLITLLAFSTFSQAQFTLGLRAGSNLSNVSHNDSYKNNPKFKFGPTAGIFVNYAINKKTSIQSELLYSSAGYKTENIFRDELEYQVKTKVKSDYLILPILAKYRLDNGLVFELGPQVGYLMEGQINQLVNVKNNQGIIETLSNRLYFNDENLTHDFEFSGVAGVGYQTKAGYSINARYTYGFTNFIKDNEIKLRNQYFSLTVGIPFSK